MTEPQELIEEALKDNITQTHLWAVTWIDKANINRMYWWWLPKKQSTIQDFTNKLKDYLNNK